MVLSSDFTDCTVLIYDTNNNHLCNTVVIDHDKAAQRIQVDTIPDELKINDNCRLIILSSPTPCEFQGKIKREGGIYFIAMFQGQEKESRRAVRYSVNTPALIDSLVVDGQVYNLQTPIKINLINISTGGVRFRAPFYTLETGNIFQMYLVISNSRKKITAEVTNIIDNEPNSSDYGCCFLRVE